MKNIHSTIAYIAGRLITGKRIASLYDFSRFRHIEISSLPEARDLKLFDEKHIDYMPGYSSGCRYVHTSGSGYSLELSINGNSFMGHIKGSSSYFVGNIRGDAIYIFDHENSAHINYRISGCIVEKEENSMVCKNCWYMK